MRDILLIDDDPELAELLGSYMEAEEFSLDVSPTAREGLKMIEENDYQLLLLDVMLPDMSGFNVLSTLRAESSLPVVMLTGRSEEIDRVVGLEMGADDYVAKPFPLRELLARIRAVLRRHDRSSGEEIASVRPAKRDIEFGDVVVNRSARSLSLGGEPVHLTSTEFDIIELLALNMGEVVERNDLMEKALGRGMEFDDYVLNVHMSNLRKKLGRHVSVKTIRGRGYLLTQPKTGAL